jgi:hypothetical protein
MNGSTKKKSSSHLGHRSGRNAESLPATAPALCTGAISYLSSGHDGRPHLTMIKGELGASCFSAALACIALASAADEEETVSSGGHPQLSGFARKQAQEVLCREG